MKKKQQTTEGNFHPHPNQIDFFGSDIVAEILDKKARTTLKKETALKERQRKISVYVEWQSGLKNHEFKPYIQAALSTVSASTDWQITAPELSSSIERQAKTAQNVSKKYAEIYLEWATSKVNHDFVPRAALKPYLKSRKKPADIPPALQYKLSL
jgi:hypothetical protein